MNIFKECTRINSRLRDIPEDHHIFYLTEKLAESNVDIRQTSTDMKGLLQKLRNLKKEKVSPCFHLFFSLLSSRSYTWAIGSERMYRIKVFTWF